jgi:hypothetical protein
LGAAHPFLRGLPYSFSSVVRRVTPRCVGHLATPRFQRNQSFRAA